MEKMIKIIAKHKKLIALCIMCSFSSNLLKSSSCNEQEEPSLAQARKEQYVIFEYIRKTGYTPLHQVETLAQAQDIINHGPDINAKDNKGLTPIEHMLSKKRTDIALLLFNHGAKISLENRYQLQEQCKSKSIPHNI